MLIEITERELATRGFSLSDREALFLAAHPEWAGKTTELLGVYLTCQSDQLEKSHVEFDAALAHVGYCDWCRSHLTVSHSIMP